MDNIYRQHYYYVNNDVCLFRTPQCARHIIIIILSPEDILYITRSDTAKRISMLKYYIHYSIIMIIIMITMVLPLSFLSKNSTYANDTNYNIDVAIVLFVV